MAKTASVPAGRVGGVKAPGGARPSARPSAAPAAKPSGSKTPNVPGVNPDVNLTKGVTVESAVQHQTKRAHERAAQAGASVGERVKVIARKTGYYDNRRWREGDVFMVEADAFSKNWMVRADGKEQVSDKPTGPNAAIARRHDQILSGEAVKPEDDDRPKGPADVD